MNILNVHEIEKELFKLAARAHLPDVKRWLSTVARNHILGHLSPVDVACNFIVYTPVKQADPLMPVFDTLPDWAKLALERGEQLHWFNTAQLRRRVLWQMMDAVVAWFNVWSPTDTRLKRIDRINFDTAVKAAVMWFKDINENVWEHVKDKPPVVKAYDEGYRWVRLVTMLHFEREGKLMNHCVHNGHYFNSWKQNAAEFFSLRDHANRPHCTIQVNFYKRETNPSVGGKVAQCKGKNNARPANTYQPYISRFIKDMGFEVEGDHSHIG